MFVDFNKNKRRYLPVKLKSGLVLQLEEPNMQMLEDLQAISETEKITDLTKAVTSILNKNKQKKKFRYEEVASMLEVSDMILLLQAYRQFAIEPANDPN